MTARSVGAAADLRLADDGSLMASSSCAEAGPYLDAQTISPMAVTGARLGASATRFVCVHNAGTGPAELSLSMVGATSTETGCRGDEPLVDPDGPSCGTVGELAGDLAVQATVTDVGKGSCAGVGTDTVTYAGVADTGASAIGPLLPAGNYMCVRIDAVYLAFTPPLDRQQNQSDRATWRLSIAGTSSDTPGTTSTTDPSASSPGADPSFLAATGADVVRLLALAVVLVGAGAVLLGLARRRRRAVGDPPTGW